MNKTIVFIFVTINSVLFAQTPCENGFAGLYPCKNVDLLSVLTPEEIGAEDLNGVKLNDLWGWTDPLTGKEYAIVGMVNGTSFIDVSDPVNPVFLGVLKEHNSLGNEDEVSLGKIEHLEAKSIWRDIKVYENHAYIVSEDPFHGMQVFDLTLLRDRTVVPKDFLETGHYSGFGNAHNIVINEETGFAYAVGATGKGITKECTEGGLHIIDLKTPNNPLFAGCFDDYGYIHDAQVVKYNGPDEDYLGKEISFNSNVSAFTIVDVTDKSQPIALSGVEYEDVVYMHQGWLTEDQQYFLSNDEQDELNHFFNTRTAIWDVRDLDNPVNVGFFYSDKQSIDHNLYIKDRYVYQSNYSAGLRVLNSSMIEDTLLSEAGYFDSYPLNDNRNFAGTWSNYPYFASGVVLISDDNGLFVVKPNLSVNIESEPEDFIVCENEDEISFSVYSNENSVTYQWQENSTGYFKNIEDNNTYTGFNSDNLIISDFSDSIFNTQFRCVLTLPDNRFSYSEIVHVYNDVVSLVDFEFVETEGTFVFSNMSTKQGDLFWQLGDGNMVEKVDSLAYIYESKGSYNVSLEISNSCGSLFSEQMVEVSESVEELNTKDRVNIFPVPSYGVVNLELENLPLGEIKVVVFDANGRVAMTDLIENFSSFADFQVDLSGLQSGVYIISLVSNDVSVFTAKAVLY